MRRFILLLVLLALIAAGCGPGDSHETTTSTTTTPITTMTDMASSVPPTTQAVTPTTTTRPPGTSAESPPRAMLAGERLEPELLCRDIAALKGSYADAVAYWLAEGRPGRMDPAGKGIPCETTYPAAEVDAFHHPNGIDTPSGRLCRDLKAEEFPLSYAVAYWVLEGAPARMDADGNGIPCETVYPPAEFEAFFPQISRWQSFTNANNIADLAVAADGTVWTVGYGGAAHWNPETGDYRKYLIEDGLASNAVSAVAVAHDGTVWFATMSGASSFDGESWETVLEDEIVLSVLPGRDGRIWFGGNDQVIALAGDDTTRFTHDDGISNGVTELAEGPDTSVFAYTSGCDGEGCPHGADYPDILRFADGVWASVATEVIDGITMRMNLRVGGGDLMFDPAGVLWATGYEPNLLAFDGETWTEHDVRPPREQPDWFLAATIDVDGIMWGAHRNAVVRFDGTAATAIPLGARSFEAEHVNVLAVDATTGTLWAGTCNGLAAYDGDAWAWYRTADALPSNAVWALVVDNDDHWVGTSGGLNRHSGDGWATFTTETLIDGVSVSSIAVTPGGTVWAGNWNSISWFDGTTWHPEGGPDGGVPHEGSGTYRAPLTVGPDGTVWATERGGPVPRGDPMSFRDGVWTEHPMPDVCRGITTMAVDPDGTLWTLGGCRALCSYDDATWTVHVEPPCWDPVWDSEPVIAQPGNVLALAIDPSGAVVTSTDQGGLLRWDGTALVPVAGSGAVPSAVTEIAFSPDGAIWAVADSDLYMLFNGTWQSVLTEPFAHIRASAIALDQDGVVWIGTEAGLIRYVPPKRAAGG